MSDDNQQDEPGTIFLVTGFLDDEGSAWFGDDTQGKPFWAAVLIPKEKEFLFNEAYEQCVNLGTDIDLALYAERIVKWGEAGEEYPSAEELTELKRVYGDHKVIDMNDNNDTDAGFDTHETLGF